MKQFSQLLTQRLAEKKIAKVVYGAMLLKLLQKYFENQVSFEGKFKNWVLFVTPSPTVYKTEVFLQKQQILDYLNEELAKRGIDVKVKDLRIV